MDEECECEIKKVEYGVGEEIFKEEDLFDRVKNFYQQYDVEKNTEDKEDLLLNNLNMIGKKELNFINSLRKLVNDEDISSNKLIDFQDQKSIEKEETDIELKSDSKIYKINYIKNYLKNLKDGS